ncbi:MAG: acetolactate synthase small subunit [Flavobacteriaceae bacterium]|nr:acetolactate synthase small subunit [Flavobacteriaceae bacterium]
MEAIKTYTISVYTENNLGLLSRISAIFLKRHINIEGLTVSKSEIEGVSRFVIVARTTEKWVKNLVSQINKQIEVFKAYYHTDDQIIYEEAAMFKIASKLLFDERQIQNIIKDHHADIVTVTPEFFVINKSGRRVEIEALHEKLKPFGILQFVRSGRIAVTKEEMQISKILKEFQQQ